QEYVDSLSNLVNVARIVSLEGEEGKEKLKSSFYYWFERRFRTGGIKENLKEYVSYLRECQPVLDLGCGRGEMLELLKEEGIEAIGVDINSEFIKECRDKGLNCIKADAIGYLSSLEDESLGGIFSSQVLEHFPVEVVEKIIAISWRKVRKGGVFISETVNVASPAAFHGAFLLDPTHITPLHPQTLSFFLESSGWRVEEIIWKNLPEQLLEFPAHNEREAAIRENIRRINGFLFSHRDYAVVARKP
ncbi:MAG: methyltransferase domain-containing protein, partial [Candidatus Aminicenantes bacterium]|nr:methyltransferase domain-containing protein [Candidatus Aminicenantes bacterium]